jgi:hypothetical protein
MPGKQNIPFSLFGHNTLNYFAFLGQNDNPRQNERQGKIWPKIVIMPGLCTPFLKIWPDLARMGGQHENPRQNGSKKGKITKQGIFLFLG